jgi:ABC-type multidrug transport system fused ATPase/permease subunit
LGPDIFFSVITVYLFISGIVFFFFDWRIAVFLIVASFLIAKFNTWTNIKMYEYYNGKEPIE